MAYPNDGQTNSNNYLNSINSYSTPQSIGFGAPINFQDSNFAIAPTGDGFNGAGLNISSTGFNDTSLGPDNTFSSEFDINSLIDGSNGSDDLFGGFLSDNDLKTGELGLGVLSSIGQYNLLGQQLDLQRDQLNKNTAFANRNLANQANLTNERLGTRQATRNASASRSAGKSAAPVAEYLAKYSADGSAI